MSNFIFGDRYSTFDILTIAIMINYIDSNDTVTSVVIAFCIMLIGLFIGSIGRAVSESRMK